MVVLASTTATRKMVESTIASYLASNPQGNKVTVSSTAPENPKAGDIWYDTSSN